MTDSSDRLRRIEPVRVLPKLPRARQVELGLAVPRPEMRPGEHGEHARRHPGRKEPRRIPCAGFRDLRDGEGRELGAEVGKGVTEAEGDVVGGGDGEKEDSVREEAGRLEDEGRRGVFVACEDRSGGVELG